MNPGKTIIGRVERVSFPTLGPKDVPAKVDTGADASSIWCSDIKLENGELSFILFAPESPYYNGERMSIKTKDVEVTKISNSFGHKEVRYKVKIPVIIKGRRIRATFTLTDRSTKLYPVLIGRYTLNGKFLVDVDQGKPLHEEEADRKKRLKKEVQRLKKELLL